MVTGLFYGYKVLGIKRTSRLELRSPAFTYAWEPGNNGPAGDEISLYGGEGFWTYKQLPSHIYFHPPEVVARLVLWGTVIEHVRGYRGEYARIEAIDAFGFPFAEELLEYYKAEPFISLVAPLNIIFDKNYKWLRGDTEYGERADLTGAKLPGQCFSSAAMRIKDLRLIIFKDANLRSTIFAEVEIGGAVFDGADLTDSLIMRVNANRASFKDAKMTLTDLDRSSFNEADFSGADLGGAILGGSSFIGADFRNAKLDRAKIRNSEFHGADFRGASFIGAHTEGIDFSTANTEGSVGIE